MIKEWRFFYGGEKQKTVKNFTGNQPRLNWIKGRPTSCFLRSERWVFMGRRYKNMTSNSPG